MIWNKLFGKKQQDCNETLSLDSSQTQPFDSQSSISPQDTSPTITENYKLFSFDTDDLSSDIQETTLPKSSFFQGLKASRGFLKNKLSGLFVGNKLSRDQLDEFEEGLILADMGTKTASLLRQKLLENRFDETANMHQITESLQKEICDLIKPCEKILRLPKNTKPIVISFVGVNGSGKTTTIGKMAHHFKENGLSVMLVAGDTFRAAATEQLQVWGERYGIPVMTAGQGSDAAALIYQSYAAAQAENIDILSVDTAGRLQNKNNLMQELLKISRVLQKYDMDLPHETILVLDATTGQNAVKQAEIFRDIANITGIVMTKLDGTAKGGVLVGLCHDLKLPIYAIGVGEKVTDLQPFSSESFAKGLFQEA